MSTKREDEGLRNLKYVHEVVNAAITGLYRTVTKYISPKYIVRATRATYKGAKAKKRILKDGNIEIILTIGKPNFVEREFIKKCVKAKEPFPVKKIQFKLMK